MSTQREIFDLLLSAGLNYQQFSNQLLNAAKIKDDEKSALRLIDAAKELKIFYEKTSRKLDEIFQAHGIQFHTQKG